MSCRAEINHQRVFCQSGWTAELPWCGWLPAHLLRTAAGVVHPKPQTCSGGGGGAEREQRTGRRVGSGGEGEGAMVAEGTRHQFLPQILMKHLVFLPAWVGTDGLRGELAHRPDRNLPLFFVSPRAH